MKLHRTVVFVCVFLFVGTVVGYVPPVDKAGPLTVQILPPPSAGPGSTLNIVPGTAIQISVVVENSSEQTIDGSLSTSTVDSWDVSPEGPVPFRVPGKGRARLAFAVTTAAKLYNAHYPIHAFAEFEYAGQKLRAHPILVLQVNGPTPPRAQLPVAWGPIDVPADAIMGLGHLPVHREWTSTTGPLMPIVANSTDSFAAQAPVQFGQTIERGASRDAIVMHLGPRTPSLVESLRSVATEWPLFLPDRGPVRLHFGIAVDDAVPKAVFRVRATSYQAPDWELGEVLFEKHDAAPKWEDAEVDLGRFRGQKIRLQFESAGNLKVPTRLYWAMPVLSTGNVSANASALASNSKPRVLGTIVDHGVRYQVQMSPGPRGVLDATVSFVSGPKKISFQGIQARVLGDQLSDASSTNTLLEVRDESANGRYRLRHRFSGWAGAFDLLSEVWCEKGALRVHLWLDHVPSPRPWLDVHLEDVAVGPWSERPQRIYAGQGNVVEAPEAFQMDADGHYLSTSFIGFDFSNSISLVAGVEGVPDTLDVQPEKRLYTMHVPLDQTITFIPSANVWNGVKAWRDINGLQASAGVKGLAGRFTFDIWGRAGGYGGAAAQLGKALRYGLTDSIVVWHHWQRWGYDYRLPDIYPPNPEKGTLEDFQTLVKTCKDHGVLFAPHDNYIDFYPDAEGFSYGKVAFESDGTPTKAWFNTATQAQSYRFRPDRIGPFIDRNLGEIRTGFAPSAYFIDVWSSLVPHDYWDSEGKFHPRSETRTVWAKAFDWIRDYLGNNAPQISEAGHDQLIGHLDGAQAQLLRVSPPTGKGFYWHIRAGDAERIPWMDAAYHDRFVLQGAGYSNRYTAGLDEKEHGIYSDDYITSEVLTGHPAMVPALFGHDVVRKYWLLHDLMRALALQRFDSHEFVGGNLHRQKVRWENGAEVYVNRGKDDWTVAGHTLPAFGFYARAPFDGGTAEAAIERRNGEVVEWSQSPKQYYFDPRGESEGFRLTRDGKGIQMTPLPFDHVVTVRIPWATLRWKLAPPNAAESLDETGKVLGSVPVSVVDGAVSITCNPGTFAYRTTM